MASALRLWSRYDASKLPGWSRFLPVAAASGGDRAPASTATPDEQPDDVYPTSVLLSLLALLCWLPALLAAAPGPVELSPAERDWLAANPRILIGSDAHWRPFVWQRDDGTQAGIETDLIARINALTGARIRLVLGNWPDMVARAERGELHGLAASASHPERAGRFLFSTSPYSTYKFIFTRQHGAIDSMADLSGRRVGLLRANLSETKLLANWPAIIPVAIDSPLELAVAVQNGRVDAAIARHHRQGPRGHRPGRDDADPAQMGHRGAAEHPAQCR
jgi:hypothetical protein